LGRGTLASVTGSRETILLGLQKKRDDWVVPCPPWFRGKGKEKADKKRFLNLKRLIRKAVYMGKRSQEVAGDHPSLNASKNRP